MAVLPAKKIATAGVLSAVTVILGITHLGLIPWFSGASITVMHVPVVIGAVLEGPAVGILIGAIFGVFSLIQAALAPTGPIDAAFINPLVSVLPRILIALAAYGAFRAIKGASDESSPIRYTSAVIASAVAGSLANTVIVLSALSLMKLITWEVAFAVAVANGIPEAVVGALITAAVVVAWKRVPRKGGKSDLSREEDE